MGATSRHEGALHVAGKLSAKTIVYPTGSIMPAANQKHRYILHWSNESASAAADGAWVIHVVHGATATINSIKVGAVVACTGAGTVDFELLKNGATVLTAAVRIDSGDAAYALVAGSIASPFLSVGDVLEIAIDETAGGGVVAKGVFAVVELDEDAA